MLGIGLRFENRVTTITAISILVIFLFSFSAFAQNSAIPDWVKNNAKWWSEGQIGESDYISSLQYLINQGIIKIPITEVTATKVSLSDSERAQSIVVFIEGEIFGIGETYYTFSEFAHTSNVVRTGTVAPNEVDSTVPTFYLLGLPSKDKATLYQLVDEFVNPGRPPSQYEVTVDILAGDGAIIQTWDYDNCRILEYVTYLESNKDTYRFSDADEAEIREFLLWECAGFHLRVP